MTHENLNQPPAVETTARESGPSFEAPPVSTPEDSARHAALEARRQRADNADRAAVDEIRASLGLAEAKPAPLEDWQYSPEAIKQEIQHKIGMVRGWAEANDLQEGRDIRVIESIHQVAPKGDTIQPHEEKQFFVGVQEAQYGKFRDYITGEYARARQAEGARPPRLIYSWGGRFAVSDDGPSFFDTVGMADVENNVAHTRHAEFREFFQEQTGTEFPTAEKLNPVVREIAKRGLPDYKKILSNLQKLKDSGQLPESGWHAIEEVKHNINVLKRALGDRPALIDLPETAPEYMPSGMRAYADLTYNAKYRSALGDAIKISGIELPDKLRLDRIFETLYGYDSRKTEDVNRQFSERLYPSPKGTA